MATLTTLVDGDVATVAPVNANFTALNTAVSAAMVCLYSARASALNVGTAATVLHSFTLPANTLTQMGSGLLVRGQAFFEANANTKTLFFRLGSSGSATATVNPTTTAPNNKNLTFDLWLLRGSTATVCSIYGMSVLSAGGLSTSPVLESAGDYTGLVACASFATDIPVQVIGIGGASNDINLYALSVWAFNEP